MKTILSIWLLTALSLWAQTVRVENLFGGEPAAAGVYSKINATTWRKTDNIAFLLEWGESWVLQDNRVAPSIIAVATGGDSSSPVTATWTKYKITAISSPDMLPNGGESSSVETPAILDPVDPGVPAKPENYVGTFAQSLTDNQKAQARENIGVDLLEARVELLQDVAHNLPLGDPILQGSFGASNFINQPQTHLSADKSTLYVFSRYGRFHTVNTSTLVATQGTSFGAGQAIDPAFIERPDGAWWVFFSENDDEIYRVISTDQGATWSSATSLHDQSASGHYEDFHVVQFSNGDVLVLAEWEVVDKGDSEIHSLRFDDSAGTWGSKTEILNTASTDYENPAPFIDPADGKLKIMVAYETGADVTYDQNNLYLLTSDDEGLTWGSPVKILSDYSFVEYGGEVVGRRLLTTATRGYSGDGFKPFNGYYSLQNFGSLSSFTSNWTAEDCAPILADDTLFLAPINGNANKLFVSRPVGSIIGNDIRIKARMKSSTGATPDLRLTFGHVDKNNHYVVILNGLAGGTGFWKRISGTYTRLSSTGTYSLTSGTYYEVEVRWNKSTGAMSVYVNGTLFDSITDTSLTAFGSVGISSSELQAQQFITLDYLQVSEGSAVLWKDDFTSYPHLTSVGPNTATTAFLGGPVVFDDGVWWLLEDRDSGVISVYKSYFNYR